MAGNRASSWDRTVWRSIRRGRLFVADRSNNRIQIFDKDMNVVDEWRHFGRPSNVWILKDDTLIVSDSESNKRIGGADDAPEGGGNAIRNPGWKNGIRIGSATRRLAQVRSSKGTRPEGLAADELGNIFGGTDGWMRHEQVRWVPAEVREEVIVDPRRPTAGVAVDEK